MPRVHVTSEIGPLRAVLVHTPGKELVAVTPENREDYLYDDIIDLDLAQREHRRLVAVLERLAEVHEVRDLLTELVSRADVREFLTTRALEVVPSDALAKTLARLNPDELVARMIEGASEESGPIARALNEVGYALPPLPNLFFTRDVGIVIGEHSIIGSMRYGVRWTEELLIKALFRYHEQFENAAILYDGSEEKRNNYTLEGGAVPPLRPALLVLGFSERASPAALDPLCDVVIERRGTRPLAEAQDQEIGAKGVHVPALERVVVALLLRAVVEDRGVLELLVVAEQRLDQELLGPADTVAHRADDRLLPDHDPPLSRQTT